MKKLTISEMRGINGGGWIAGFTAWARACAYARLVYEHQRYGRCSTSYRWMNVHCPICGK